MSDHHYDVSIVIPSFQQGAYIQECLESVLSQQDINVEILLFDSCSTDETHSILARYSNLASIHIERDLGQAHAINKGLKLCRGEMIGFLNSDDILLPRSLEQALCAFRRNKKLDLLYGKAYYVDEKGERIGQYKTKEWNWKTFQGECYICQPAAFWSRRIMEKIGLLDQKLHCSMDYDYWLRIVQSGGVVEHLDEHLACSRDYPQTKTRHLRGRVFFENFQLSLRRLGYIHASWISQYLDYLKYERNFFFSSWIPSPGRFRDVATRAIQNVTPVFARDIYFTEKQVCRLI